jgi:hypothetical protein
MRELSRRRLAARRSPAAPLSPKRWHRERRFGAIAAVIVAFLFVLLLSVYGIQTHMAQAAARAAARDMQAALATGAALNTVAVLFVPDDGNVCRRRWIDNMTWTLRDGGKVDCDDAAQWNIDAPTREQKVERRLGAIRDGFQAR